MNEGSYWVRLHGILAFTRMKIANASNPGQEFYHHLMIAERAFTPMLSDRVGCSNKVERGCMQD